MREGRKRNCEGKEGRKVRGGWLRERVREGRREKGIVEGKKGGK